MKKILHIIATPKRESSKTLKVTNVLLDALQSKYPQTVVDELDLFKEDLPELTMKRIDGKYELLSGKTLSEDTKQAWADIVRIIERFLSADMYVISVPMWNFSIPYKLKHYIDVILQPKYLFEYTSKGPRGLLKDKKMIVVTSRGGDYSSETFKVFDFQQEYLRTIFAVAGIVDIQFIHAQPMDAMGIEVQNQKIKQAQKDAVKLVDTLAP